MRRLTVPGKTYERVAEPRAGQRPQRMLELQRLAGNRAVSARLARPRLPVQRDLGFELEMLALVDDNGGQAEEKKPFGTYNNLTLDVDHSTTVETQTPNDAKVNPVNTGVLGTADAAENAEARPPQTYDSIIELVTPAYPPETEAGAVNLTNDIQDAVTFANSLSLNKRVPATSLPGVTTNDRTDRYSVGNPAQGAQTTDASWQATLGIRLDQIGPLFDKLISQTRFVNKHQSDTGMPGHIAKEGMAAARRDAAGTVSVSDFQSYVEEKVQLHHRVSPEKLLADLGGFLTLVSQYVRMGQEYGPSGTPKNIVSVLSRTNLSEVRRKLMDGYPEIYGLETGTREQLIDMLTDTRNGGFSAAAALRGEGSMTVQTFLRNVLFELYDDVTNAFLGFKQMPFEVVNQHTGEEGPVVEVRNIAKPPALNALATDRFATGEWAALAAYFITTVAQLNTSAQMGNYDHARVKALYPEQPTEAVAPQGQFQQPMGGSLLAQILNFGSSGQLRGGTQTLVRALADVYKNQ
jgi:hypothetical protein